MAHGVRLGAVAAAGDGRCDVVLVEHFDELERLAHDHTRRLSLEVIVAGDTVDLNLTRSGLDPDAGDRRLSLAGGVRGFLLVSAHRGSRLTASWRTASVAGPR